MSSIVKRIGDHAQRFSQRILDTIPNDGTSAVVGSISAAATIAVAVGLPRRDLHELLDSALDDIAKRNQQTTTDRGGKEGAA